MPIVGTPISGTSGDYWTWDGIKNQLGKDNAEIRSQLDNEVTTADMDRVEADGTIADAVVNRRARLAGYVVPISESSSDFDLVRLTANLYASFLIAKHRQWFDTTGPEQEKLVGLEAEANEWLDRLFGPDPGGLDAEQDGDATIGNEFDDIEEPIAVLPTVDRHGREIIDVPAGPYFDPNLPGGRWQ